VRSIYLDSNILIAYYSNDRIERSKKQMVQTALEVFFNARDAFLCTSNWAVTEMVNVLISSKKIDPAKVTEIERRLAIESFGNHRVKMLEISPDRAYHFSEFFADVRHGILSYHSGVGDVIHSVIMKNNGVDHILTFDEKDDFKQIPGLTVFHPGNFRT
jgi:predicted nucleic acid-binding protein